MNLESIIQLDQQEFPQAWSREQWEGLGADYWIQTESHQDTLICFSLFLLSKSEGLAHLLKICTAKKYRKQGFGRAILENNLQHLKQMGFLRVYLEVACHNQAALAFYQSFGFEILTKKPHFYSDGSDAYAMQFSLENLSNNT